MKGIIKTVCVNCGTEQRVEVNFPSEKAGFESTLINCIKCSVSLIVTDLHKYNGTLIDCNSVETCAVDSVDLSTCNTIFAVLGKLYCSKDCAVHDLETIYGNEAEEQFNYLHEEIVPSDIGIEM